MIRWAMETLGERQYAGWCLAFVEDAREKSNDSQKGADAKSVESIVRGCEGRWN